MSSGKVAWGGWERIVARALKGCGECVGLCNLAGT